jgi:hypothetical protein
MNFKQSSTLRGMIWLLFGTASACFLFKGQIEEATAAVTIASVLAGAVGTVAKDA